MFPFFLFLNRSFSFLRHCCVFMFRSRFPLYFVNSFHFVFSLCHSFLSYVSSLISLSSKSLLILLTSLLYICVWFLFFSFLTPLLSYRLSIVHCISSILSDFVYFSLSFFLFLVLDVSFVFLNRSFSFLRHCYVFDFRCRFPILFRQFSPTSFAFSVVLCLSRARCFLCFLLSFFSFLTSLLCVSSLDFPLYFVKSL